ncbi:hypothetical protein MMC25_000485 [Agyrium rufum]|nr:hypothetical protein [Agyrium rufum]
MPPKGPKSEFIETDTGNKVSRRSQIHGTQHIVLGGRTVIHADVCIRGDLARPAHVPSRTAGATDAATTRGAPNQVSVSVGRYTILSPGVILKPSIRTPASSSSHARSVSSSTLVVPTTTDSSAATAQSSAALLPPSTFIPQSISPQTLISPDAIVHAATIGSNVVVGKGAYIGKMVVLKDNVMVLEGAVVPDGMVVPSGWVIGGRPARYVGDVPIGWEGVDGRGLWRVVK